MLWKKKTKNKTRNVVLRSLGLVCRRKAKVDNRVLEYYRQCLLSHSGGNEGGHNANRKVENDDQAERYLRQTGGISYLM